MYFNYQHTITTPFYINQSTRFTQSNKIGQTNNTPNPLANKNDSSLKTGKYHSRFLAPFPPPVFNQQNNFVPHPIYMHVLNNSNTPNKKPFPGCWAQIKTTDRSEAPAGLHTIYAHSDFHTFCLRLLINSPNQHTNCHQLLIHLWRIFHESPGYFCLPRVLKQDVFPIYVLEGAEWQLEKLLLGRRSFSMNEKKNSNATPLWWITWDENKYILKHIKKRQMGRMRKNWSVTRRHL